MSESRKVLSLSPAQPTIEGAGVRLKRVFGKADKRLDPFLLLDDFGSEDPEDYLAGFPWHPHRGIETITYMLEGDVKHGDSLGNSGTITAGDVQWMTAGSGIIHEEMPQRSPRLRGCQLWANLPAAHKMIRPRYRDIKAEEIPRAELADGVVVKVICGTIDGVKGPVDGVVIDPRYLDVALSPGRSYTFPVPRDHNAFAYLFEGEARFDRGDSAGNRELVVFDRGDEVQAAAGDRGARFLLVSGKPIGEPVAWGGPIVMNTQEELRQAFQEVRDGTFIRHEDVGGR